MRQKYPIRSQANICLLFVGKDRTNVALLYPEILGFKVEKYSFCIRFDRTKEEEEEEEEE